METEWLNDFVRKILEPVFEKKKINCYRLNKMPLDDYRLSNVQDNRYKMIMDGR